MEDRIGRESKVRFQKERIVRLGGERERDHGS